MHTKKSYYIIFLLLCPIMLNAYGDNAPEDAIPASTVTRTPVPSPTSTATPVPTVTPSMSRDEAIQSAKDSVTSNHEWESYIAFFDEVERVLVPTRCFVIGLETAQGIISRREQAIASRPEGMSWVGAFDMVGNVAVTRGGNFFSDDPEKPHATWRGAVSGGEENQRTGVRCVREIETNE